MKKKILSFCLAFALIIPAIFLLSACGGDKGPTKQERTNTAKIVSVYQDYQASLYVEVTDFEHTDWEFISNSGYNACTLEFSINDGEWFTGSIVQDFYDENGKGVYQILNANYQLGDSEITSYSVLMTGQTVPLGEITVSVRIPESDKYYPSAGSEKQSYTLKQYIQTSLEKFMDGLYDLGSMGYSDTKEERYAFYRDSADPYNIKIGKFYSEENTEENNNGEFKYELKALTSEEENAVFTELNLEYKVVTYNSKYMILHEDNESVDVSSIENDENDCVYSTRGWTNQLNLNQNYIWEYESNGWKYESVIFLIRQEADENTVQSKAFCYENIIDMVEISQQNI